MRFFIEFFAELECIGYIELFSVIIFTYSKLKSVPLIYCVSHKMQIKRCQQVENHNTSNVKCHYQCKLIVYCKQQHQEICQNMEIRGYKIKDKPDLDKLVNYKWNTESVGRVIIFHFLLIFKHFLVISFFFYLDFVK